MKPEECLRKSTEIQSYIEIRELEFEINRKILQLGAELGKNSENTQIMTDIGIYGRALTILKKKKNLYWKKMGNNHFPKKRKK